MPIKKDKRPEWFKFWRSNREILDIDPLSMESRGKVFTNLMRYFDGCSGDELLELTPLETMAFHVLKKNADASFKDYDLRTEINKINGAKGGRPRKTKKTE